MCHISCTSTIQSNRLQLLTDMIAIDTTDGKEAALAEWLASRLGAAGIQAKLQPVEGSRCNLVATLPGRMKGHRLILTSHLDTVPIGAGWTKDPFTSVIEDGKLYGRGASDTKSSLAAMAAALIELAESRAVPEYDIVLLGTAGEEKDMAGARAFVAGGGMADAGCLVVGEPTNQLGQAGCVEVVNTTKGCLPIALRTKGLSSHGAQPSEGVNAVLLMTEYLHWLSTHPPFAGFGPDPDHGLPTWAPTVIKGGQVFNMIPAACEAFLDTRPIPGMSEADTVRPFFDAAASLWGDDWKNCIDITSRFFLPPLRCPIHHPVLQQALAVAASCGFTSHIRRFFGASDVSYLCVNPDMPFFLFGPGIESQAHKADEFLWVSDYLAAVDFYKAFSEKIFGLRTI